LKHENLLLDKEENLKISDFGLSNFARTDDLPPDASVRLKYLFLNFVITTVG